MEFDTIYNSIIRGNKVKFYNQGIFIYTMNHNDNHFLTIENNYFSNCTFIIGDDIEIHSSDKILFSNNTFSGNGVWVECASYMEFVNNSFINCGI